MTRTPPPPPLHRDDDLTLAECRVKAEALVYLKLSSDNLKAGDASSEDYAMKFWAGQVNRTI